MNPPTDSGPAGRLLDEAFGCVARGDADGAKARFAEVARLPAAPPEAARQAHYQLGLIALAAADPAGAASRFARVHSQSPDFPGLALNYGKALLLSGEAKAALPHLRRAAANAGAQLLLARALAAAGEAKEASALFEKLWPGSDPDPGTLCDFALALERAGENGKAELRWAEVREKFPGHFDSLVKAAKKNRDDNFLPQAARCLQTAARIAPGDPQKLHDLGILFHELGLKNEAEAAFKKSLALAEAVATYGQLASLYEKANDLNSAWATATLALRKFPGDPYLNLTLARCERRAGKTEDARARLETLLPGVGDQTVRVQILFLLGWLYDDADDADKAFATYREAKKLSAGLAAGSPFDAEVPLAFIRKMADVDLNALPRVPFTGGGKGEAREVAFLVGFPRSGTTLLNQILDSHPALVGIEEKPILPLAAARLGDWKLTYPGELAALGAEQVAELRADYFRLARDYVAFDESSILIDKLPLNIVHVPFVLTLFPDAKIILALRHPLGCALSCFTHNFRLNNAMVHMFTLQDITALYAKVMGLWLDFAAARPMAVHAVRYEDVIADLAGEGKKLCRFLGVPFSAAMLKYDQHARAKGLINTPSYHQVVRPLYAESVERWRRYEEFLRPQAGALEPFIKAFGYGG